MLIGKYQDGETNYAHIVYGDFPFVVKVCLI